MGTPISLSTKPPEPSIGKRLLAAGVDLVLLTGLLLPSFIFGGIVWWAIRLGGHFRDGQSIGKRLMGVRIVDRTTYMHPRFSQILRHDWLFLALYLVLLIDALSVRLNLVGGVFLAAAVVWVPASLVTMGLRRTNGLTVSDLWSHTTVVDARGSDAFYPRVTSY